LAGSRIARIGRFVAGAILAAAFVGCQAPEIDSRPSVLLIVVDTLRADAVSAYGAVEGTTPHIDALARDGLLYTNAFAPSPWTLPSHASLFTGLDVGAHGVGIHGRMALPEDHRTLSESLTETGYRTVGFSENPLISVAFGFTRGFERFCSLGVRDVLVHLATGGGEVCNVVDQFDRFAEQDTSRPFFAFVNLYDPHAPYTAREVNRFVPPDLPMLWTSQELATTSQRLCDALPNPDELKTLHGLYLGDVADADAKIGRLVERARAASRDRGLIVIVTSDHGELFGERRLLEHEFTLNDAALRIPLVVSGLADTPSVSISAPVTLSDITGSILRWTGTEADLGGEHSLPTRPEQSLPPRDLMAWYSDALLRVPAVLQGNVSTPTKLNDYKRSRCNDDDRVFGDMLSITRWPHKLVWYERYAPPELYDLSWDSREKSDRSAYESELVAHLREAAVSWHEQHAAGVAAASPSPEEIEALRGLGYLEPSETPPPN